MSQRAVRNLVARGRLEPRRDGEGVGVLETLRLRAQVPARAKRSRASISAATRLPSQDFIYRLEAQIADGAYDFHGKRE